MTEEAFTVKQARKIAYFAGLGDVSAIIQPIEISNVCVCITCSY
jgi:hypothetical protein